jgi:hypothetical protein
MRTGVTAYDADQSCPGFVLFNPNGGGDAIHLIDLSGREVHAWRVPHPPRYAYFLPNGNLFAMLKSGGGSTEAMWPGWRTHQDGMLVEIDWHGRIVWEHRDPYQHHDGRRTPSGGALYLTVERVPAELAARVTGGAPDRSRGPMWADVLVEVDASGRRTWEWRSVEHLDPARDALELGNPGHEWTHGNTIAPLEDDRVLVSFRNISVVAIIDKRTGDIVWRLGDDVLAQQHDANMLPSGNVLIFDNGASRRFLGQGFSRVIEVDPSPNQIVWEYRDRPALNFYSPNISGARRLPNGNTLITEGRFGRIFQVTPAGEVVWEYVSPHFVTNLESFTTGEAGGVASNAVFRATHYSAAEVPGLS